MLATMVCAMTEAELQQLLADAMASYRAARYSDAERLGRRALSQLPDHHEILTLIGLSALNDGRASEAIAPLSRALERLPDAEVYKSNLAMALSRATKSEYDAGRFTEAARFATRSLELDPRNKPARYLLGASLAFIGRLSETLECFREGARLDPADAVMHSNVLFTMLYEPNVREDELLAEHRQWWKRHGEPLARSIAPHANDRNPDRPIRMGYLSPNFREHPIAFFVEPILAGHDRKNYPITCYHDSKIDDDFTKRLRGLANDWVDVSGMPDDALAARIRADGIDVLVDLNQHMASNRMTLFARKPAPVQVAYLGYPYTTGLPTIDYRLSDPHLDRSTRDAGGEVERIVRLPETYFCYAPPTQVADVSEGIPSDRADGVITFGSFNQLLKLNDLVIGAWSRVLAGVPRSRLLIKAYGMSDMPGRDAIAARFEKRGVARDRLDFEGQTALTGAMKSFAARVDVALDTFPYPGGTTTCHLLWMGVPVVTMAGPMPFHRMGVSVLANVGLSEWIAKDSDDFLRIAVELANDVGLRREMRESIRRRMRASPLMDAQRFTRHLEASFRDMWRTYCGNPG